MSSSYSEIGFTQFGTDIDGEAEFDFSGSVVSLSDDGSISDFIF